MQFNNTLNISDILEIITLITILIGGFLLYINGVRVCVLNELTI